MKKIINGKRYDTETAEEIGFWSTERSVTDFSYCEETLYRKRTGEFFIHGGGGARTKYAKEEYGMYGWGEAIVPLTEGEAKTWVEQKLDADTYEALFPVEDEDVASMESGARLASYRAQAGLSQSDLAAKAGCSKQLICACEQGWRSLKTTGSEIVMHIAKALGCTVEDLIG